MALTVLKIEQHRLTGSGERSVRAGTTFVNEAQCLHGLARINKAHGLRIGRDGLEKLGELAQRG